MTEYVEKDLFEIKCGMHVSTIAAVGCQCERRIAVVLYLFFYIKAA